MQELTETPIIEKGPFKLKPSLVSNSSFDFKAFSSYLQGIAGGNRSSNTASSIVSDVQRYISFSASGSTTTDNNIILQRQSLETYFNHLKIELKFKPTTILEKMRRIGMAIKFLQHHCEDNLKGNDTYLKAQKLLDMLRQWAKSLSKQVAMQRQEHSKKVVENLPFVKDPNDILDNPELKEKVQNAIHNLTQTFFSDDAKLLTAYCAALLLYNNSQRSGVIENTTIAEYKAIVPGDSNRFVINCHNHKTGPQGVARLVMEKPVYHLLENYFTLVREKITPQPGVEQLLFLTVNGSKYNQVYRKIREQLEATMIHDITPPTPSEYRIVVQTDSQNLPPNVYKKVTKHLSHSEETSRRFYEFMNNDDAISAHEAIKEMAQRRRWTEEETANLLRECPVSGKKPDIKTCEQVTLIIIVTLMQKHYTIYLLQIKLKYNMSFRTPKNILDKWRQLKDKELKS